MCDILLVNANLYTYEGRRDKYTSPYQGTLYLAAALEAHGYRVAVRDYQTADVDDLMDIGNLAAFLETDAPMLGVSCRGVTMPLVVAATRRFKERHPATRLVLGGPGPSGVADHLLASFPHVDVVVRGEGEETLLEVMRRGNGHLDDVAGLSYRRGDAVQANPPRPRIGDLDRLPNPAYHHVVWDRYERADVETARGCPYNCTFCSTSPFFQRLYVARSIDTVIAELALLVRRYGVRRVFFTDDTFVVNRPRVLELCRRLRSEGLNLQWECYARVDLMDESLMEALASAGCTRVLYGIESGSNAILEQLQKGITVEQAERVASLSTCYFPCVALSFMWGLPFESMADFEATLEFAARLSALGPNVDINFSLWTPLPSSPLYAEWGHLKEFSPSLVPLISPLPRGHDESPTWRELIELIRCHPEVFPALYYVPEPNLSQKQDTMTLGAWLAGVLARIGAADERVAAGLAKSPEACLRELHLEPNPVALLAAAGARRLLDGGRQVCEPAPGEMGSPVPMRAINAGGKEVIDHEP